MRICLNMIVKNEVVNLPRCLNAVAPFVSSYAILDTGSTDGTQDLIRTFFDARGVKGVIMETAFENFAQARNLALVYAREMPCDYILFTDADMEFVGTLPDLWTASAYDLLQKTGNMAYWNTRMLRRDQAAEYVGVTHEYLSLLNDGRSVKLESAWFIDHATGSNRPEKFERDRRLLQQAIKDNPNDARSLFYLANTYRDAGQPKLAIPLYQRRIALGGWDEEVWHSQLSLARCWRDSGPHAAWFIENALEAYNMRPSRAEPLYDLAKHFREKGKNSLACMFAQQGMTVPPSGDLLFNETYPTQFGFREELAIAGFYVEPLRPVAACANDGLRLDLKAPEHTRHLADVNSYWYIRTLEAMAPSFKAVRYDVPLDDYVPMNPSVTLHNGALVANIRYVNYRITEHGHYDMQGDSAIRTRNVITPLNADLTPAADWVEVLWERPAPAYDQVIGFEDSRVFSCDGSLMTLSNVREQNAEGWCEQTLARLDDTGRVVSWRTIKPQYLPRQHEKNWMPWYVEGSDQIKFVYRLGVTLDRRGQTLTSFEPTQQTNNLSGGGNVVPFKDGCLVIVHQALANPRTGLRYYQHRFVRLDLAGKPIRVGPPFVFFDRQIEFAAGLCWHPTKHELVISFGVRDREAWFCSINADEVPL